MNCITLIIISTILLPSVLIGELMFKEKIPLPAPRIDSNHSIEKALLNRRSIRDFSNEALSREEISQLLWACQGISKVETLRRSGKEQQMHYRTAPSAGALYPLEIYVLVKRVKGLKPGLYHYLPGTGMDKHCLKQVQKGDFSKEFPDAALGQGVIEKAAANIIITGVIERTAVKYGSRARHYVLIEVGHAAQNLCLQAESLDVGVVTVGGFHDDKVREFIGHEVEPLYILSVGKKK